MEYNAIDSKEFKKNDGAKTLVQLKSANGTLFIDIRKWYQRANQSDFGPTRHGIMLTVEDWKHILPLIQEVIDGINCNVDGK